MQYLQQFRFPTKDDEWNFFMSVKLKCYDTFYPFGVLSAKEFFHADFSDITIFCGENGSGKTTALNVIAEKLGAVRDSRYNRSSFFENYLTSCTAKVREEPSQIRMITSDDVFDYMLNIRALNQGIDTKRDELTEQFLSNKFGDFHYRTLEDYDKLKQVNLSRRKTMTQYIRHELMDNIPEHSNGENAFSYFSEKIQDNGLYLLDEPENSLSASRQQELAEFLENEARFFGCQFVISTHSPFLLALKGARIYSLDETPVRERKFGQLDQMQVLKKFFNEHDGDFPEEYRYTDTRQGGRS